jgi:steroid delta-isomerase-like uncharacterized protein
MTSQTRAPEDVARSVFEATNNHDADAFRELIPPDGVDDFVPVGEFRGPDAIVGFFKEIFAAFPDFKITIDRILPADSTAVVQWHLSGTFTGGTFQGILPTGRRVELRGVDVMEVSEGRIRRNTIYFDGASMARQIGMLPQRDSPADKAMLAAFNGRTKLTGQVKAMRQRRA